MTNSGQDCHVFWQIGSSATLGMGTDFIGTVMALTSATLTTGANVEGRVLAQNGTVTLDTNTITKATCASPTSTPTPTSSSTPTSTPTPTSSSTSAASSSTSNSSSFSNSSSSTVGPILNYIAPIIIESKRIGADSIFISWGPYSGIDTFNVRYGLTNGNWLYNTNVTGFSTTINALPSNQPIWIQVATRDNFSIGTYGESKFVGGPGLPNTGFAPFKNSIPWYTISFYFTNGLYEKQVGQRQIQSIIQNPEAKKQVLAIETPKESQGFPVRLKIPTINVDSAIEYVGLTSEGNMEVPNNTIDVGWFGLGPHPGEQGSAVIAGHFDGKNGEAGVFANLHKLKEGDKLYIEDSKGAVISFVVRESRTYDPGYADDVFSPNDDAHLNLVTCNGIWDGAKKSYSKRLVVFADIIH